jgi:hypothetical protein
MKGDIYTQGRRERETKKTGQESQRERGAGKRTHKEGEIWRYRER